MTTAPIVVVGAGPAGSVAAARLARAGRRVLLLEAGAFPRDKVCGDVLLPEVDELLQAVGTDLESIAGDAHRLHRARYAAVDGVVAVGGFRDLDGTPRPWRILPRRKLDARLAHHAVACGAELLERHRLRGLHRNADGSLLLEVTTPAGSRAIKAALVVGADGATSRVARETGLRPGPGDTLGDTCVALRGYVSWRRDDPELTLVTDDELLPGLCWIVPQAGGTANVGIGMIERDRRARGVDLRERFERLMGGRPGLGGPVTWRGWQLPTGSARRRVVADGVMLVGDAAGLVDPFTGHGIHTAMASALAAADVADGALCLGRTDRDALVAYDRRWRRELLPELRLGRLLQRVHARPAIARWLRRRAASNRGWADRLMGVVGHAAPRSTLLRPGTLLEMFRRTTPSI